MSSLLLFSEKVSAIKHPDAYCNFLLCID